MDRRATSVSVGGPSLAISSGAKKVSGSQTPSQEESQFANEHDIPLDKACERMADLRKARGMHVAVTWPQLRQSLANLSLTEKIERKADPNNNKKEVSLEKAMKEMKLEERYNLTEGEAAAVLLYTAEDDVGAKVYNYVNDALREKDPEQYMVFIATLVSALRKLRAKSDPVNCVCHWTQRSPVETDNHFVTRSFLSATCVLDKKPGSLANQKFYVYLIPYKRRAAVIPEYLSFNPDEKEVIFEPGTAFRRVAPHIYEELPPADLIPMYPPQIKWNKRPEGTGLYCGTLFPAQQTQLLFPIGMPFLPLKDRKAIGSPPVPAATAAAAAAAAVTVAVVIPGARK